MKSENGKMKYPLADYKQIKTNILSKENNSTEVMWLRTAFV